MHAIFGWRICSFPYVLLFLLLLLLYFSHLINHQVFCKTGMPFVAGRSAGTPVSGLSILSFMYFPLNHVSISLHRSFFCKNSFFMWFPKIIRNAGTFILFCFAKIGFFIFPFYFFNLCVSRGYIC
jgi:hypothetical protein